MVATTVAAAAACSGDPAFVHGPKVHRYSDGTRAVVAGPIDYGMEARLAGRLVKSAGGCVAVDVGGRDILVAFPDGTVEDSPKFALRLDGRTVRTGDTVELGGGTLQGPYAREVPRVPAGCGDEIFLANRP